MAQKMGANLHGLALSSSQRCNLSYGSMKKVDFLYYPECNLVLVISSQFAILFRIKIVQSIATRCECETCLSAYYPLTFATLKKLLNHVLESNKLQDFFGEVCHVQFANFFEIQPRSGMHAFNNNKVAFSCPLVDAAESSKGVQQ